MPIVLMLLAILGTTASVAAITITSGNDFSSATSLVSGDSIYIHGVATGHPQQGLQVWLFGCNYAKIATVSTNADYTYDYKLTPAETRTFSPGQYFVLIQHPMMNGIFDVYYDSSSGSVITHKLGPSMAIFQLTGRGSLQTPASASALMDAINCQNIDDTFAIASFIVNPPTAIISPIGNYVVGDQFAVSGLTNLAIGDTVMVEITSSSFKPTSKSQSAEYSGTTGHATVVPGAGTLNHGSFKVDSSTFKPDDYTVKVSGTTVDVSASTFLTINAAPLTTNETPIPVITVLTSLPVVTAAIPTAAPTTKKSSVSVFVIMGAVGLTAMMMLTGRK